MKSPDAYTDNSYLEIGEIHIGKQLKDVPEDWFRWFYSLYDVWYQKAKEGNREDYMISAPHIKTRYLLCEYIVDSIADLDHVDDQDN